MFSTVLKEFQWKIYIRVLPRTRKVGRILSSLLKSRGDLNKNREIITAFINPLEIWMGELSPIYYF